MSIQTQMTPINIQVLQSVLHIVQTGQKDITKIKLTLQFDDQQKYNKFVNRFNPTVNEDEDIMIQTDSDDEDGKQDEQKNNLQISHEKSNKIEVSDVEKLSRLELSIILKQNYKEKIQQISKNTRVRILIVPEKLKYFGLCYQDIEQAMQQVHEIKKNISISTLQSGKQIYQSTYLRDKLNKQGIKLGKLAQKYYYWYQYTQQKSKRIKLVLQQILHDNRHILHPLLQNFQTLKRKHNPKYIQALIKANAKLYSQFLQQQINDDKNDHKIQLNRQANQVIIHVPVQQQAQIVKIQIRKFYSEIIQFFIHYKVQQNQQINNINKIQELLNQKGILWTRYQDIFVISYNIKDNKQNQSIINNTLINNTLINNNIKNQIQKKYKQFLQKLKIIFDCNTNCSIQYLQQIQDRTINDGQSQDKSIPLQKKIFKQYKKYDGIFVISPKNQRSNVLIQIIQQYILKPKLQQNKIKINQQSNINGNNKDNDNDKNASINNTNSNMIHDTTSQIQYSNSSNLNISVNQFNDGNNNNNNNGNGNGEKNNKMQKNAKGFKKQQNLQISGLLGQIRVNTTFINYKFFIPDMSKQIKYKQEPKQLKRGKTVKTSNCQQLQQLLKQTTKHKYYLYSTLVPRFLQPQKQYKFKQKQEIVTVFVRDNDKQILNSSQKVNVYLIIQSKAIATNGWLLNIRKSDIKENQFKYQVQRKKFQVVYYVRYSDE